MNTTRATHRNLVVLLLGMMQFRCVSAFASRLFATSHRWGAAVMSRGGSSSSPLYSTSITKDTMVKDSMTIFDTSCIQPQTFAGIPYWNTTSFQNRVFFVLGGPGAGKGTQCDLLSEQYPCVHFSVGELLRNVPPDNPNAALIENTLVEGKIVPVEISLDLLKAAMSQETGKSLYYLVDGFPRNYDNLQGWNQWMQGGVSSVYGVLMFTCPLKELERRILERGETSGRSDDNLSSLQRRFHTFETDTVPVVNVLRKVETQTKENDKESWLRVFDIQGDRPLETVWEEVQCIMNQYILHDVVSANAQLIQAIETGNAELYASLIAFDTDEHDEKDPTKLMQHYEGESTPPKIKVSNGLVDFITGTKVTVSYDRVIDQITIRETRVWSHQGERGWVNIHFFRLPAS